MGATFGEYTTIQDLRASYLSITTSGGDALLLDLIREASAMIRSSAKTWFEPRILSRNFDIPRRGTAQWPQMLPTRDDLLTDNSKLGGMYQAQIDFDLYLLEVVSLTNGDGSAIASTKYFLYPANYYPKRALKLKATSGITWLLNSAGEYEQVIALNGVWGYHEDYANAWQDAGTILTTSITTSSATYTASSGHGIKAGQLLKMESEYAYASAVNSDVISITRGVNGSTAASHNASVAVSTWAYDPALTGLCRKAAAGLFRLRNNPVGESIVFEGMKVETPKDIQAYIDKNIDCLGISRVVFA